jgi:hypothetical protein
LAVDVIAAFLGIASASEVYQTKLFQVIGDADGTANLVDDVLIYGTTQGQHDEHIRVVMNRLRQHNVTLSDKPMFIVSEIQFAGRVISSKGISSSPDRVRAVVRMPPQTNVSDVRFFLVMVSQLVKFTGDLA